MIAKIVSLMIQGSIRRRIGIGVEIERFELT